MLGNTWDRLNVRKFLVVRCNNQLTGNIVAVMATAGAPKTYCKADLVAIDQKQTYLEPLRVLMSRRAPEKLVRTTRIKSIITKPDFARPMAKTFSDINKMGKITPREPSFKIAHRSKRGLGSSSEGEDPSPSERRREEYFEVAFPGRHLKRSKNKTANLKIAQAKNGLTGDLMVVDQNTKTRIACNVVKKQGVGIKRFADPFCGWKHPPSVNLFKCHTDRKVKKQQRVQTKDQYDIAVTLNMSESPYRPNTSRSPRYSKPVYIQYNPRSDTTALSLKPIKRHNCRVCSDHHTHTVYVPTKPKAVITPRRIKVQTNEHKKASPPTSTSSYTPTSAASIMAKFHQNLSTFYGRSAK